VFCLSQHLKSGSSGVETYDNGTGDDVEHVSMILLRLEFLGLFVREQTSNSGKMDISREESQSEVHLQHQLLAFKDEPISLLFVVIGAPMVVQVVQEFGRFVELVDHSAESEGSSSSEYIERVPLLFQEVLEERHSRIS
jgi:hypothetical protein